MGSEHKSLFLHKEVCWLTLGKVLRRIYKLREVVKFISAISQKLSPGSMMKCGE